jgi:aminopeptidase N
MMKHLLLLFVLCANTCNAQQKDPKETVDITLDTVEVIAPAGPTPYQPSAPRMWDIKNTRIALSFNFKEKTAYAREWIKLHPYFYPTDTLVLDAKSMQVDSVYLVTAKGNKNVEYVYGSGTLKIYFDQMYRQTDTITLFLKYTATPYATTTGGSRAITDDRGLYFINTDYKVPNKPAQIWTQGETESNSRWMITIDKPNSRFTTQLELTVPDSFVTLSNGALIKQTKAGANRTDVWRMDMPIQAYAVMFAIGKFSVVKDRWKNKEVNYYVEPEYAPHARAMFKNTPEMIEFFSRATGVTYPWNKYSQVVVRDYVSGAMENTTASLFGEFMNQTTREIADKNSEDVVSHELFHQWFGDYVTAESWSNLTLNESFANYGEQLWRNYKYGKASGDELAYNDLSIYVGASMLADPQLVRFTYDSREEVFDAISYNKGGAILRYLNSLAGDSAFYKAMKLYLTKNALSSAEAHQWRLAVEEATGLDWNWFFNEWYYHPGHPVLKVVYNYNDSLQKLVVDVTQSQKDSAFVYNLPLKAAVIYGDKDSVVDWKIDKKTTTFTYPYKGGQKPVVIPDYTHVLPGEIKDGKKMPQWLTQYLHARDYIGRRLAVTAAGKLISDSVSQIIIGNALGDSSASIRKIALTQIKSTQSDKYHKKWIARVSELAASDGNNLVRAEALDVLGSWKATSAKAIMIGALSDSSYAVAGNALDALNKINNDTAYILAKAYVNTNPRSTLETTIWSIIGKKAMDEDIALYERRAPYVLGSKKFAFAFSLNNYLKNVKSIVSFQRGIDIYVTLITTESMKAYRTSMGGFLFQAASEQQTRAKSENKDDAALGQQKLGIVKVALQKVLAAEKDEETLKEFNKMMKNTFQ